MSNNGLMNVRTEAEEYRLFSLTRDMIDCCEYAILCGTGTNPALETAHTVLCEFLNKLNWGEMSPVNWIELESALARWKHGFLGDE